MTVVAWDGERLAADKRTSFGGLHGTTTKVFRIRDCLVAGCGAVALVNELQHWFANGANPEDFPSQQRDVNTAAVLLVVPIQGALQQYENSPYPLLLENKQWAIGSGRDFAMMAMYLGKSAEEAVALTALFCDGCGNGVDALGHDN